MGPCPPSPSRKQKESLAVSATARRCPPHLQRLAELQQAALGGAVGGKARRGVAVGACSTSRQGGSGQWRQPGASQTGRWQSGRQWQMGAPPLPGCNHTLVPPQHRRRHPSPIHSTPPHPERTQKQPAKTQRPTCSIHEEDVPPRGLPPHHTDGLLTACVWGGAAEGSQPGGGRALHGTTLFRGHC